MSTAPSSPSPWLAHYPPGVPATVDTTTYRSLVDLLESAWRQHADRDAAVFMGARLRFQDVDRQSASLAAWLQSRGLNRGDRVAVMMPNVPQYLSAIGAILRAGCVVVNVNPLYTPRELEHQLNDAQVQAIFVLENMAHTLDQVIRRTSVRHVVLCALGDRLGFWKGHLVNAVVRHVKRVVPPFELPQDVHHSLTRFNQALAQGTRLPRQPVVLGPDDVAFLQYTGGTTGVSKGATLLHRNMVANILQTEAWFKPTLERRGTGQPLTMVCALPLYHIFALTICYLMGARLGMTNLLIPNPRDLTGMIRTLSGHKIHMFPAVNTLFNGLLHHPDFAKLDWSELLVSNTGGMALQRATAEKWLKATGCPVVEGYGLSETSPVASSNRLDLKEFNGSIGMPIPSTEITIRNDAGQDVPPGTAGEICIRGPQVMAGYWGRPDETALAMTADGFFRSGDIGVMDERGQLRIVDRKKDMVLVSGFNVYPTEVEQVVNLHPGVLECAAIGVADARTGEAVKLFVVRRDPTLTTAALADHCARHLTAYKRPRCIEFCKELPKSNVGKVLRRELRAPAPAATA